MSDFFAGSQVRRDLNAKSLSFYWTGDVSWINREVVQQLIRLSRDNGNCNARICLHTTPEASFHEMVILEYRDHHYYRPHKHLSKGESCHLMQGEIAMFAFDDAGEVLHVSLLGEGRDLICRVGANQWHTVIPISEYVIYHEAKPGPFLGERDSIYPDWCPDGSDKEEARTYIENLVRKAACWKLTR
ncbi:MAG: cupin fold metalloprotein, WbuC family [Acidobacteria bacterium]|nr:cupin fold metalloprotein, WbuC family [Acidobacteriota bacterium]